MLYPDTEDSGLQESETLCCVVPPDEVPVPVIVAIRLGSVALLAKLTLPGVLPAAVGAKLTLKVTLLPAETVSGKVIPLSE